MKLKLIALCAAIGILGTQAALAQQQQLPELMSIVGAPFSGVRTWQGARNFVDGNRIDRGETLRLYRDSRGRTRVEREVAAEMLANRPRMEPVQITISDPVSGDRIELRASSKTAIVLRGRAWPAAAPMQAAPPVFITFAGHVYDATDRGWSTPVSLGEKSFDGLRATGQRWQYTLAIGTIGNEKPIVLTVDQWFSPELSLIVAKGSTSSLGGSFGNQVENIVRGEPDPALFLIPSDYSRIEVPQRRAAVR